MHQRICLRVLKSWGFHSGFDCCLQKSKQYDEASWDSSSESDSNCHIDQMHSKGLLRSNWGQKICNKQLSDGTPMCFSCFRFKKPLQAVILQMFPRAFLLQTKALAIIK
ncbi:hypothetical protein ACET3Z_017423 [Daucus carota]